MSNEEVEVKDSKKKGKADYAEVEFEIGNIEFEAKGRSLVVERMFKLLLEKIEEGKLVATLKLEDGEEVEEEEEEEEPLTTEEESHVESTPHESPLPASTEESSVEPTLHESPTSGRAEGTPIPNEAYLDPPPAWDSLEEESPPESDAERKSRHESL